MRITRVEFVKNVYVDNNVSHQNSLKPSDTVKVEPSEQGIVITTPLAVCRVPWSNVACISYELPHKDNLKK